VVKKSPPRNSYVPIDRYARAKLLSLLWAFAFARRPEGSGITVNATNPGMAWTPLTQVKYLRKIWLFLEEDEAG
jgi:NAD(P)-dependent dehydrogenase (short-subunit alcohol dehydrogenase family)